jgi:hypothetical protein
LPGKGGGLSVHHFRYGRGKVAETNGISDAHAGRHSAGWDDQQWNANFLSVKALAVTEIPMLTELFAMIRGNDHEHVSQHATALFPGEVKEVGPSV